MELHQVRYFLTLAQTLNFTRAAEQCNVTQPALTKAVQKLEYEFGGPLIHRERHLTQLTELGKLVLPMLERMMDAANAARSQANEFRSRAIAPLHIGLAPSISASLMVEPLAELSRNIRGLRIELAEDVTEKLVERLLEGEIHAAITGPVENMSDRIDCWKLFEERYVAIAARDHPFAQRQVVPLNELREAIWLGRESCEVRQLFTELCFSPGSEPKVSHCGRQETHLQHMVAAGLGVLLSPEHAPCLPSVVTRPIEGDPVRRHVQLLVVAGRRYSPALNVLVKMVLSALAPASTTGPEHRPVTRPSGC
jgi:DNA-binding transcriptional LysR family regulator